MKKNPASKLGFFNLRLAFAFILCLGGAVLALLSFAAPAPSNETIIAQGSIAWIGQALAHTGLKLPFTNNHIVAVSQPSRSFAAPRRTLSRRSAASPRITSQTSAAQATQHLTPIIGKAVVATVSPPVRDLPAANQFSAWVERPEEGQLSNRGPQLPRNPLERDPVVQSAAPTAGMPPVDISFEGINVGQACMTCLPPDTNGAVGPNHYVQMVNEDFAIYSKSGATLVPPKAINTLWMLTPNAECATHNNGDPIVVYDQLADRWLLSQFVASAAPNYAQCIAISQTPDPAGAYWLYEFDESVDTFHDYPHIGVWPDGYYMSTNLFPSSALLNSTGAGAWAFERARMLLGQAAKYIYFDETPLATNTYTPGGQLPATVDGRTPPPAGAPNYFVEVDDTNTPNTPPATGLHDEMHIWQFHVDWTTPANSTFGAGSTAPALKPGFPSQYAGNAGQPNFIIPIADFIASGCKIENGPNDCSPQKLNPPQPAQYLDVLGDRLMFRLVYRNFGDHEVLLVSHTADTSPDPSTGVARNGVRWYEVRNLSTTPNVYQQGTFAPLDPTSLNGPLWRWMGSAAMDHSGDIAIGYSASGPNYFPSLHYAGRLAGDMPLNELNQGEAVMFAGLGIEANTGIFPFRNRWGDYSNLTVDPTDDCTFWYTNEYLAVNNPTDILPVDWHTRIGSFKFAQCVPPTLQLQSVVSRKVHGTAGTFDINLPLPPMASPRGVECRGSGGVNDYSLVFTFTNNLVSVTSATVTNHDPASGTGTVCGSGSSIGPSQNQYAVNLCGVSTGQYITVTLNSVLDVTGATGNVLSPQMGVLVGDVNASGVVTTGDTNLCKAQALQAVTASNFRNDINASGAITTGDVNIIKQNALSQLPTPP